MPLSPYLIGYHAHEDGEDRDSNPYLYSEPQWEQWERGFADAEEDAGTGEEDVDELDDFFSNDHDYPF